mgnify:CR=1 FL=1
MSISKRLLNLFKKNSVKQIKKDVVSPAQKVYNCSDVYVLLVRSKSTFNDGSGCNIRCANFYLAGTKVEDKYYELFSGVELKTSCSYFNKPYIKEVKPLKEYLTNPKPSKIDGQLLFDFLSKLNTDTVIKMLIDKEREAQDCNAEDEDE